MTPGTGLLDLGVAALDLAELSTGGTGRGHECEQRDGQSHRHSIRPHGDASASPAHSPDRRAAKAPCADDLAPARRLRLWAASTTASSASGGTRAASSA